MILLLLLLPRRLGGRWRQLLRRLNILAISYFSSFPFLLWASKRRGEDIHLRGGCRNDSTSVWIRVSGTRETTPLLRIFWEKKMIYIPFALVCDILFGGETTMVEALPSCLHTGSYNRDKKDSFLSLFRFRFLDTLFDLDNPFCVIL